MKILLFKNMRISLQLILVFCLFIFGCSESNNPVIQEEIGFSKSKRTLNSFFLINNIKSGEKNI